MKKELCLLFAALIPPLAGLEVTASEQRIFETDLEYERALKRHKDRFERSNQMWHELKQTPFAYIKDKEGSPLLGSDAELPKIYDRIARSDTRTVPLSRNSEHAGISDSGRIHAALPHCAGCSTSTHRRKN